MSVLFGIVGTTPWRTFTLAGVLAGPCRWIFSFYETVIRESEPRSSPRPHCRANISYLFVLSGATACPRATTTFGNLTLGNLCLVAKPTKKQTITSL